jgi:hypothetical protein
MNKKELEKALKGAQKLEKGTLVKLDGSANTRFADKALRKAIAALLRKGKMPPSPKSQAEIIAAARNLPKWDSVLKAKRTPKKAPKGGIKHQVHQAKRK